MANGIVSAVGCSYESYRMVDFEKASLNGTKIHGIDYFSAV